MSCSIVARNRPIKCYQKSRATLATDGDKSQLGYYFILSINSKEVFRGRGCLDRVLYYVPRPKATGIKALSFGVSKIRVSLKRTKTYDFQTTH